MWLTKFFPGTMNTAWEHEQIVTESLWIGKKQQAEAVTFALQGSSQVHAPYRGVL